MVSHSPSQSGASLMEVLVSAVLISMIFLWISETHTASLSDISDVNNRNKANWLTEEILERIKTNPYLDDYKAAMVSAKNKENYCKVPVRCQNQMCSKNNIIKYDIQQIICHNNPTLNDLTLTLECFDINTGQNLTPCARKGTLRVRITTGWNSGNQASDQLSTYSEALFVINQSLYFNGQNNHLRTSGRLLDGDFTLSLWVKPDIFTSGFQGLFGKEEEGLSPRSPSLLISSGNGLAYDSYDNNGNTNRVWCIPPTALACLLVPYIDYPEEADRYHSDRLVAGFFPANQWTHVTWIKQGSSFVFYKNAGQPVTVEGIPSVLHSKEDNWIGTVAGFPFQGELDDIQIYGSVLSEAQILRVMAGHQFADKNLLLHLDFEGDNFNDAISDKSEANRVISSQGGMNENNRRHSYR